MLISTVGVVTNSSSSSRHQRVLQIKSERKAIPVAPITSSRNIDLIYGGGSIGLMGLVSQVVHDGGRHVIGLSFFSSLVLFGHGVIPKTLMPREVADLMAFIASASSPWEENKSNYIDSFGNQCLSVFRTICLPSTTVLIRVSF
ncbi:unnamed protein product, partial [Arabidopsis halleri]